MLVNVLLPALLQGILQQGNFCVFSLGLLRGETLAATQPIAITAHQQPVAWSTHLGEEQQADEIQDEK